MAAVNVQMGVAVAAFDTRPDAARDALREARTSSREALQELRATVALLRDADADKATKPAPRLSQLDDLVESAGRAGVTVALHRQTGPGDLPAVVELTAYRIVQEALTNVARHAGAVAAAVWVTRDGDTVRVEITDDGVGVGVDADPGRHAGRADPGHGLVGMAERAAALGGRVEHGPVPGGGFRVRATLPVAGNGGAPA
jgi:signal transduction histidine kinase